MPSISIDFETRSAADLPKIGAYRYAIDPSTEVMCLAIRFEREDTVHLWHPAYPRVGIAEEGVEALREIVVRVKKGWEVHAWNAMFERCIWEQVLLRAYPHYGLPSIPHESWRCSAAIGASYALPRRLEDAAAALGLKIAKDKVGYLLMRKMSRPAKTGGWHEDPEDLTRLFEYCKQDVRVECAVADQLRPLSPKELAIWQLDQRINLRGVYLDRPMVEAAIDRAADCREIADDKIWRITQGVVRRATKREDLLDWVRDDCGVPLNDTQKNTLAAMLDEEGPALSVGPLPVETRKVLELWRSTNRSSVKKYNAMFRRIGTDSRVRDTLRYWGASTGRWAGQGIQPQNFPRGVLKKHQVEEACCDIRTRSREDLELLWGDVMELLSSALRGAICAAPGQELLVADYSAIEARGTLWMAGDDRALAILESGACIYKDMAGRIYGDPDAQAMPKDDPRRQLGKQAILGLGYSMGAPKFVTTCGNAGIEVDLPFAVKVVKLYRETYSKVVELWYATEAQAIEAIRNGQGAEPVPGAHGTVWAMRGRFLHCRLPSGRLLSYYRPWVTVEPFIWTDPLTHDQLCGCTKPGASACKGDKKDLGPRPKIKFWGLSTLTKRWGHEYTYGGKLVENIVQALSRDLMAEGMLRLEAAGYPTILTVHDETVSEVPKGYGSNEEYERLVVALPSWAKGLPVEAEVWRGTRYRK